MSTKLGTQLLAVSLTVLAPVASAADYYRGEPAGTGAAPVTSKTTNDYGETVAMKAGSGFTNMALGWLEVPKNMIATSNQVNLAFGITGGLFKGLLHTIGRTLAGTVDLVTSPLPTQPIVVPNFVWENFDMETHYGPAFKLKN
ncbi:MAG: hypothetical protein H6R26_885 [Proteobacteria bacterium]|nr:hypothetical protein [Pseudomonadota bacterium]